MKTGEINSSNFQVNPEDFFNQVSILAEDLYSEKILSGARSFSKLSTREVDDDELDIAIRLAKKELKKSKTKKIICAALKSTRTNIREVAKIVAATLLPLSLSGTITLPVTPIVYAAVAVIIFDVGVSTYCNEGLEDK